MNPQNEYRSLMLRKINLIAQQHGGSSKIPRELQKKLGFDVIAGRKGSFSISVRIPDGDLSSRIAELKSELPKITFESAKPDPERIFGKYVPQVSLENPTMDDFWIMQSWYKKDRVGIKLTRAKWADSEEVRIDAIRFLVEKVLKKDPRGVTYEDFISNRMKGVLNYYCCSPYAALFAAGYKFNPWEMLVTPKRFFDSKENRVAAIRWIVQKLQKNTRDIGEEDFNSNCLGGLLVAHYKGSSYEALVEAGYAHSMGEALQHAREGAFHNVRIYPWEMATSPMGCFKSKEHRVAAIKWLVSKSQKDPRDLTQKDFRSNNLGGLAGAYYNSSPHAALIEAGYAYSLEDALRHSGEGVFRADKAYPWEMSQTPHGFYGLKENRVATIRWLAWKIQKSPREITAKDFDSDRLCGMISNHYNNSPYSALLEAGLVTPEDEKYMRSRTNAIHDERGRFA